MNKYFFSLLTSIAMFNLAPAQDSPFKQYGDTSKILTLSDGRYSEIQTNDSLQKVGSVIINMNTKQIVGFVEVDTLRSEATLEPEVISRFMSVDPIAKKFPMLTPYQYASNSPIWMIDLDGLEGVNAQNINVLKTGKTEFKVTADVTIKYKILNLSKAYDYEIDLSRYNSEIAGFIKSNLETVSSGTQAYVTGNSVSMVNVTYDINTNVVFEFVTSMDQIKDNDFAIVVVDELNSTFTDKFGNDHTTGAHVVSGTVAFVPKSYMTSITKQGSSHLIKHELFHFLGLDDLEDKKDESNLMYHLGSTGTGLNQKQIFESTRHLFDDIHLNKIGKIFQTPNKGTRNTIKTELKREGRYRYDKDKATKTKSN